MEPYNCGSGRETNGSETEHSRQATETRYRSRDNEECKSGIACGKCALCDATNSYSMTCAAEIAAGQPSGRFSDVAICAGLRPEDVLVYVEWSQGRANRPYQKQSTVAATSAALCKVTVRTRSNKIMVITMLYRILNRFSRFSDDKTSVLHNEIRYTTKFSPINWGYSRVF